MTHLQAYIARLRGRQDKDTRSLELGGREMDRIIRVIELQAKALANVSAAKRGLFELDHNHQAMVQFADDARSAVERLAKEGME